MTERTLLGGTDGFRGAATDQRGPGLMNQETLRGLTYELVQYQQEDEHANDFVVVARDTRPSSEHLTHGVIEGALARGAEVWDLGVAPTPVAQYIAKRYGALATVVVTASHNRYTDNGWKGMLGAEKPSAATVRYLSDRYWDNVDKPFPDTISWSKYWRRPELTNHYIDEARDDIQAVFGNQPLRGKNVVVDGANGAAAHMTPQLLRNLGAHVVPFSCDSNGTINEGCGAANLSGLAEFLADRPELTSSPNFIGAVANDGDADRIMGFGAIASGHLRSRLVQIDGNHAMYVLSQDQPGIVGTEYTNSSLVRQLHKDGVGFAYCENGDINVTEALRQKQYEGADWTRGGEFTGHLIDIDWLSSGDGVHMAGWLTAYAATHGITFGDLHSQLPLWDEHMLKIPFASLARNTIKQNDRIATLLASAEQTLGEHGRVILRASGTEPVVRVWGESESSHTVRLQTILAQLQAAVAAQAGAV